jgi:hypothetical protein
MVSVLLIYRGATKFGRDLGVPDTLQTLFCPPSVVDAAWQAINVVSGEIDLNGVNPAGRGIRSPAISAIKQGQLQQACQARQRHRVRGADAPALLRVGNRYGM